MEMVIGGADTAHIKPALIPCAKSAGSGLLPAPLVTQRNLLRDRVHRSSALNSSTSGMLSFV